MSDFSPQNHWDEQTSQRYLDSGRYFVPEREAQMNMIAKLLEAAPQPCHLLELCCGEGLLAELILEQLPGSTYWGLDGSPLMLGRAGNRLSRFASQVSLGRFELADTAWRQLEKPVQAIISSMAIHHLDGAGKQVLFRDMYHMLAHGGVFIIADMIQPVSSAGNRLAADAWDEVVRKRTLELEGSSDAFDFFVKEGWNTYRFPDPDDFDHPSPLFEQLKWMELTGFSQVEVHFLQAGHALFSGWKVAT